MGTPGDKRKYGKVVLDDPSSLLDPDEEKPPETPPHLLDLPPAEHQPSTSAATTTTEMGVYRGSALPQFESFTAYISPSLPQTSAGLGNGTYFLLILLIF